MTTQRISGVLGILAALLVVISITVAGGDTPDGDASGEEWVDYIADNEPILLIRAYLLVAAGLSIVALYTLGIAPRFSTDTTGAALARLGGAAAILGAAFLGAGGLVGAAVAGASQFGDVPVDAGLAATFDNFVYGFLLVGGGVSLGVLMLVVAVETRRKAVFPQWVLWLSVLGVIGMAAALIFVPFVLLPIWLIGVSVAVLRAGEAAS